MSVEENVIIAFEVNVKSNKRARTRKTIKSFKVNWNSNEIWSVLKERIVLHLADITYLKIDLEDPSNILLRPSRRAKHKEFLQLEPENFGEQIGNIWKKVQIGGKLPADWQFEIVIFGMPIVRDSVIPRGIIEMLQVYLLDPDMPKVCREIKIDAQKLFQYLRISDEFKEVSEKSADWMLEKEKKLVEVAALGYLESYPLDGQLEKGSKKNWMFDRKKENLPIVLNQEKLDSLEWHKMYLVKKLKGDYSIEEFKESKDTLLQRFYEDVVKTELSVILKPYKELLVANPNGFIALYGDENEMRAIQDQVNESNQECLALAVYIAAEYRQKPFNEIVKLVEAQNQEFLETFNNTQEKNSVRFRDNSSSKGRIEYLLNSSSCFVHLEEKFLLTIIENKFDKKTRTRFKLLTLPGGKRFMGEFPIECALRELYEETGININMSTLRVKSSISYYGSGIIFMIQQ